MRSLDVAMAVLACALPRLPRAATLGPYTLHHTTSAVQPTLADFQWAAQCIHTSAQAFYVRVCLAQRPADSQNASSSSTWRSCHTPRMLQGAFSGHRGFRK